jgi:hypothetical protein
LTGYLVCVAKAFWAAKYADGPGEKMACMIKKLSRFRQAMGMIFLMTMFMVPSSVRADTAPRMVDLLITSNTEKVLLYARLANCFKPEMESAIMAGVPAIFTLHIEVYQERSYLWNKNIVSKEIHRTIKYDNLKKSFLVTTNGDDQPTVFPDFQSAQKAMADLNGISVVPLSRLSKGNDYHARVKVKMDKVRLPFKMEYVLFFVSLWDFETPLYKIRFSY